VQPGRRKGQPLTKREIPMSLWVYAVVATVPNVAAVVLVDSDARAGASIIAAISVTTTVLLLRGSRLVWLILTAAFVVRIGTLLANGGPRWVLCLATVSLICLLAPGSWRYLRGAAAQVSGGEARSKERRS
jgi:hypothetical protein